MGAISDKRAEFGCEEAARRGDAGGCADGPIAHRHPEK